MVKGKMTESVQGRSLRQLTLGKKKTAGRNSSGCITSFHRGGGSKRLLRKIDLKRSIPSVGIVERIEGDPNRSSRIALVRWISGVFLRRQSKCKATEQVASAGYGNKCRILEPATAKINSVFSFSSVPGKVDPRKVDCLSPGLKATSAVAGLPTPSNVISSKSQATVGSKETKAKDVFISALSSPTKAKVNMESNSLGSSFVFPRIAVAGAMPAFFAPRMREQCSFLKTYSLSEVQKWRKNCVLWAHRIKRQAALSWGRQDSLGLVGELKKAKPKMDQLPTKSVDGGQKDGASKVERAPFTYILASQELKAGQTVMNCDLSKPSQSGLLQPAQNAYTYDALDLNSKVGNCLPLANIRMGTWVHNIERRPGQGAKMVRAAGTFAKVMKEPGSQCLLKLPSGVEKLVDSRCRATIGLVSNPNHGAQKLRKAGQSRWLGRRPVVRGVAMNPIDHPHGGGEGRTKGGRPSVSPWGKPTKAGFRTVLKVAGKGRV